MATLTLTLLRRNVCAIMGLDNTDGSDQDLVDSWLNEAYEIVLERTHCKVRPATMALTASEGEYSLNSGALAIIDIYNTTGSDNYLMERVTLPELAQMQRVSSSASAPARYYYAQGDYLEVWPLPGSGETLKVWYVPRPTALSDGADTPSDIPAEFHNLLELYALSRAAELQQHKPSQYGASYMARFEAGLSKLARASKGRAGSKQPVATWGRKSRYVSNDPSVVAW